MTILNLIEEDNSFKTDKELFNIEYWKVRSKLVKAIINKDLEEITRLIKETNKLNKKL